MCKRNIGLILLVLLVVTLLASCSEKPRAKGDNYFCSTRCSFVVSEEEEEGRYTVTFREGDSEKVEFSVSAEETGLLKKLRSSERGTKVGIVLDKKNHPVQLYYCTGDISSTPNEGDTIVELWPLD